MTTILQTNQLTKVFGRQRAVDNVSITVKQGDIYGLIGRNGAGKTTLMRVVSGLAQPTSGEYQIFDQQVSNGKEAMTRISCLIEDTGIYPTFTAKEHLKLKGLAIGVREKGFEDRLLELVGLQNVGKKSVRKFSMGMKRRLGIALALVGSPDLVILDEPINGLDPQGIVEVRKIIAELNQELGLTFIISSHILEELSKLATRFGIIDHGQVLEELDRETLEQKSQDRIVVETEQAAAALLVLDNLNLTNYRMVSEKKIEVYEGLERTGDISLALAQQGIPIKTMVIERNSLEDYYLQLTSPVKQNVERNEVI
ncbi:MAG TPA: ATP-binding cassette domain-containing protein [Clostridiaceae bacterium]|nr:ATP-binding cassette domain-containing protein [Clostridiaceae bacterium]